MTSVSSAAIAALPGAPGPQDVVALSPATGAELGHLALQAGMAIVTMLDTAAGTVGVVASDLRALYVLQVAGTRSAGSLARQLMVQQSCVTLIADRLQRKGLVQRERDPDDGRRVLLRITPAGRRLLDEAAVKVRADLRVFFAPLSADDATTLAGLLGEVVEPWTSRDRRA